MEEALEEDRDMLGLSVIVVMSSGGSVEPRRGAASESSVGEFVELQRDSTSAIGADSGGVRF